MRQVYELARLQNPLRYVFTGYPPTRSSSVLSAGSRAAVVRCARRGLASARRRAGHGLWQQARQPPVAPDLGVEQARSIMNTDLRDSRAHPIALPTLSDEAVVEIRNFIEHVLDQFDSH